VSVNCDGGPRWSVRTPEPRCLFAGVKRMRRDDEENHVKLRKIDYEEGAAYMLYSTPLHACV
jgi:hypothetical protein